MVQLFSTAALLGTGTTHQDIRRQVAGGELIRVRRGYYRRPAELSAADKHRVTIRAVLASLVDGVVVSHSSAAILHGLPVPVSSLSAVTVSRPGRGRGRLAGGVHLRRAPLDGSEVLDLDGGRVTTLERTVVDLARTLPFDWAVAAADAARRREVALAQLDAQLERSRRWPGNAVARAAVEFSDPRAESAGESRSRAIFALGGLPTPALQHPVTEDGVLIGSSDFAWEEAGVLGEFDGMVKYGDLARPGERPSDVLVREKAREDRLRAQGWLVVRWTWRELQSPDALCERISRILARGPGRVPGS